MSAGSGPISGSPSGSLGGRERSRFRRVVALAGTLGILVIAAAVVMIVFELNRKHQGESWAASRFGLQSPVKNRLGEEYQDTNGDLIADPPAEDQCIRPSVLRFAYIPESNPGDVAPDWQPFLDRLSAAIGVPVEYFPVTDIPKQLILLKKGELHVTGLNTGSVPQAVNMCGFVPVSAKANSAGDWSVRMKFIVPAKSDIKELRQVRGNYFTFTNNNSNSGCKLAIVTLLKDYQLLLGRDYNYRFSTSHDESIRWIKEGEAEIAAVASDMLERKIAEGEIAPADFREVYASDPIPGAAFGYYYGLAPDLAAKVRAALTSIDLGGTPIAAGEAGDQPPRLISIDYARDFRRIRDVDDAMGKSHSLGMTAAAEVEDDDNGSQVEDEAPEGDPATVDGNHPGDDAAGNDAAGAEVPQDDMPKAEVPEENEASSESSPRP